MLSTVTFIFSATTAFAAVSRNMVDTRFLVTQFNGGEFPMSIGTCNPFSVLGDGTFQRATCDSATQLTWRVYQNPTCQDPAFQTVVTNSSLSQTGEGTYLDFDCTGTDDESYVDAFTEVEFSTGTCETNTKVIMSAALNTCVVNTFLDTIEDPNDIDSLRVYCDSTVAELQYFRSPLSAVAVCDDNDNFYQVRNATATCGYMLTATTDGGDVNVFGKLIECSVDPVPTMAPDSASSLSIFGVLLASIFVGLFM